MTKALLRADLESPSEAHRSGKPSDGRSGHVRAQSAAAPWRRNAAGEVEVLLITSRETHRWVIPKGWPMKGKSSAECAAQEAFEEAGVTGRISKGPVGVYAYDKRLKSGRLRRVLVSVYALEVEHEAEAWPEAAQREKRWAALSEAARAVDEPELTAILERFRP